MNEKSASREKLPPLNRKAKFKTVTRIDLQASEHENRATLDELDSSFAFNPSKLSNKPSKPLSGSAGKALSALQTTAKTIQNPNKSLKARVVKTAASKLSKQVQPQLLRETDREFVGAVEALERAKARGGNGEDESLAEACTIDHSQTKVDDLQAKRETMKIAWMTGRHAQRVKAVDISPKTFPPEEFFERKCDCGVLEYQWGKWLGYKLLHHARPFTVQYVDHFDELPYSSEVLQRHVERLVTASAPLQTWVAIIRRIYRWENPEQTALWMTIYFVLWHISHLVTFLYGYLIYLVVNNYFYPKTLEVVKESMERSSSTGVTAMKISEMINNEASEKWLNPMMKKFGPQIQVQVADLANLFEMLHNFYHWKRPAKTWATLVLLSTMLLVCLLTDADFCLRILYLFGGLTFFLLWPISSRYPQYRLLVSPLRWMFWDIPTHAEWAFQYLQARSTVMQRNFQAEDAKKRAAAAGRHVSRRNFAATEHSIKTSDLVSFPCTYKHSAGHLIISLNSFRFEASHVKSFSDPVRFHCRFLDLDEMCKGESHSGLLPPLAKLTQKSKSLILKLRTHKYEINEKGQDGEEAVVKTFCLEKMIGRDKAFNSIIGFSGRIWQNLEVEERPTEKSGKED